MYCTFSTLLTGMIVQTSPPKLFEQGIPHAAPCAGMLLGTGLERLWHHAHRFRNPWPQRTQPEEIQAVLSAWALAGT